MPYMGIDPGMSGGVAVIRDTLAPFAQKMPPTESELSALIGSLAPSVRFAVIEKVHSMPGQGVASTFKFGMNYGFLRGLLITHRIPFQEVTPQA